MARFYDEDARAGKALYQELSKIEKCKHIWAYYKSFLGVILALAAIVGMVYAVRPEEVTPPNLNICFVNTSIDGWSEEETGHPLIDDYEAYLGEGNDCRIMLRTSKVKKANGSYNTGAFMMNIAASNLDVLILDAHAMDILGPNGCILQLDTCMDGEILESIQERLIYCENAEGMKVLTAIDITDTVYVEEMGIGGEEIYVAFPANSNHVDRAQEYVRYLLGEYEE